MDTLTIQVHSIPSTIQRNHFVPEESDETPGCHSESTSSKPSPLFSLPQSTIYLSLHLYFCLYFRQSPIYLSLHLYIYLFIFFPFSSLPSISPFTIIFIYLFFLLSLVSHLSLLSDSFFFYTCNFIYSLCPLSFPSPSPFLLACPCLSTFFSPICPSPSPPKKENCLTPSFQTFTSSASHFFSLSRFHLLSPPRPPHFSLFF